LDQNLKIRKFAKELKRNNKPKESAKDSPEWRGIPGNYFHPNPSDKEDEENHLYYIPPWRDKTDAHLRDRFAETSQYWRS
jgi:hypothetical protein